MMIINRRITVEVMRRGSFLPCKIWSLIAAVLRYLPVLETREVLLKNAPSDGEEKSLSGC